MVRGPAHGPRVDVVKLAATPWAPAHGPRVDVVKLAATPWAPVLVAPVCNLRELVRMPVLDQEKIGLVE